MARSPRSAAVSIVTREECSICEGDGRLHGVLRMAPPDYAPSIHAELRCPECEGSGFVSISAHQFVRRLLRRMRRRDGYKRISLD